MTDLPDLTYPCEARSWDQQCPHPAGHIATIGHNQQRRYMLICDQHATVAQRVADRITVGGCACGEPVAMTVEPL